MSIESKRQLENTRTKLKLRDLDGEPVVNAQTRDLTRQSLKRIFNQLTEEIVRFEARRVAVAPDHQRYE